MTLKNWLNLSLLSLFWGTSFFFYEKLLIHVSPIQVVILRLCFGAAFLLIYCLSQRIKLPQKIKDWTMIFIMAFLINALPFTLFAFAQTHITGSVAAILNSNTAFLGLIAAVIFIKEETLSIHKVVGIAVGFIGVIYAIGIEHIVELNPKSFGQWLVIVATVSYALAGVFSRLKMSHLSGPGISCAMLMCSSIQILILGWLTDSLWNIPIHAQSVLYGLGIGVFCTALAYLLYMKLIQEAGASNTALCTLLIPIVAISFNAITLGETLEQNELIGFVIIFAGLVILNGKYKFNVKKT